MPIHAKKEVPFEVELTPFQAIRPAKKKRGPKPKPFVPPDPRCEECFYWQFESATTNTSKCCHHLLRTGERRKAISETECGSFLRKEDGPKARFACKEVPITQWGCPELVNWKSQR